MPHLSGECSCGRVSHYPKGAKVGDKWTCRSCGRTWTIVASGKGKPLNRVPSKPYKKKLKPKPKPKKRRKPRSQKRFRPVQKRKGNPSNNSGCMAALLVVASSLLTLIFLIFKTV